MSDMVCFLLDDGRVFEQLTAAAAIIRAKRDTESVRHNPAYCAVVSYLKGPAYRHGVVSLGELSVWQFGTDPQALPDESYSRAGAAVVDPMQFEEPIRRIAQAGIPAQAQIELALLREPRGWLLRLRAIWKYRHITAVVYALFDDTPILPTRKMPGTESWPEKEDIK